MRLPRRRRHARFSTTALWRRLQVALLILVSVLVAGTAGYLLIGLDFMDALYQTVITVSTVGYREVGDVDTDYQLFTIALIMLGAGSVLYTIGVLLETLVEGRCRRKAGYLQEGRWQMSDERVMDENFPCRETKIVQL